MKTHLSASYSDGLYVSTYAPAGSWRVKPQLRHRDAKVAIRRDFLYWGLRWSGTEHPLNRLLKYSTRSRGILLGMFFLFHPLASWTLRPFWTRFRRSEPRTFACLAQHVTCKQIFPSKRMRVPRSLPSQRPARWVFSFLQRWRSPIWPRWPLAQASGIRGCFA